jgi:hypothetical protein
MPRHQGFPDLRRALLRSWAIPPGRPISPAAVGSAACALCMTGSLFFALAPTRGLLPPHPLEFFRCLGLFRRLLHVRELAARLAALGPGAGATERCLQLGSLFDRALAGIVARRFIDRHWIGSPFALQREKPSTWQMVPPNNEPQVRPLPDR